MRVIGIDVGFAILGWSIIEKSGSSYNLIEYGVIETAKEDLIENRLKEIYSKLSYIIQQYKPDVSAVESLFFFKNQKTVINVGQVRGVILLALANNNIEVNNYTPLEVKVSVTGYGRAEKKQVQEMVKLICKLDTIPKPDDAADAIAIGICHLNTSKYK